MSVSGETSKRFHLRMGVSISGSAGLVTYVAADGLGSVAVMIESGTLTTAGAIAAALFAASYGFLALGLARMFNAFLTPRILHR